ncbi:5'-methylthioadenosine/S-adenosylhomocysteine nucleosidase [Castellaniella defragrans]
MEPGEIAKSGEKGGREGGREVPKPSEALEPSGPLGAREPPEAHELSEAAWGIVAALRDELSGLLALVTDKQCRMIGSREFWTGRLNGHPVVLVQSRVGKVAAASTAATLIAAFNVKAVVLTGVAGGLAPGVAVGDVVISDRLLQHDVDASPLFPRWEVPLTGLSRFEADDTLVRSLAESAALVLGELSRHIGAKTIEDFAIRKPAVHVGLVISGDRFIADAAGCQALRDQLPEALAVEMEGAAMAQVCHEWGVPFVAIRAISDSADDAAGVDFSRFLVEVAARYGACILQQWLSASASTAEGRAVAREHLFTNVRSRG